MTKVHNKFCLSTLIDSYEHERRKRKGMILNIVKNRQLKEKSVKGPSMRQLMEGSIGPSLRSIRIEGPVFECEADLRSQVRAKKTKYGWHLRLPVEGLSLAKVHLQLTFGTRLATIFLETSI